MQTTPPIAKRNKTGLERTVEQIIPCIQDTTLKRLAQSYFGCFRFQKMGTRGHQPCDHCHLHQLYRLHLWDSQQEDCMCADCTIFKRMDNGGCEDYPEDQGDDLYDTDH